MRGFTLIELLVVLLIIAAAALVVVVNAPPGQSNAKLAAERFALGLRAADEAAALTGQPLRLVAAPDNYSFERYGDGEWAQTVLGKFPAQVRMPNGVLLFIGTENPVENNEEKLLRRRNEEEKEEEEIQRVLIDPAGLPVVITAEFTQRSRQWRVTRNMQGEVSIDRSR